MRDLFDIGKVMSFSVWYFLKQNEYIKYGDKDER